MGKISDRVARNRGNGSFVLANGRGAAVEQTSALARAPYIAVAELTGTAAQGRILLAAPITQAEIELRFADQIENTDEISFDRGALALRARRKKTLHAITLSEAPLALQPSVETARPVVTRTTVDDDVQSALVNLGYRPKDAEGAIDAARKDVGGEAEVSALLRAALRQLTK